MIATSATPPAQPFKEDALKEQEKEHAEKDAEKEDAEKEQEKAPWDNEAEWAWHDAHAEAWAAADAAADAAAAAAADEEQQKAQNDPPDIWRELDELFKSFEERERQNTPQTPRTRGRRIDDHLQIALDDLFSGTPSKKTCRRQQQQPEDEVQGSQRDFWRW